MGSSMVACEASEHILERTFREVHHELCNVLFGVLRNREDAHDAAQTAFLKCWQVRHELDNIRDLRAWLFRVGLNTALDARRRAERRRAVPLELLGDTVPAKQGAVAEEEVHHREHLQLLHSALGGLHPAEREVFLLRQDAGLTCEQIAARQGRPVGTVKTRMRRALRKLRERLGRRPAA